MSKPKEKNSLRKQFVESIQHKILSGELSVGTKLPTERQLAEELNVSRQVINSGMDELKAAGFIKVVPRHGTYVADFRVDGNINTLNAIMDYKGEDLREEEIRSILEVRWGLEHLTIKNAIDNATDADILALGEIVKKLGAAQSPEEAATLSFEYQMTLATIGRNTVLPLIISSFKAPTTILWERFVRLYGVKTLYDNTARAFKFIEERDYEQAVEWLNIILRETISGGHRIYRNY
ncbi:DNA-binding transcriptional regulator, FadR family [Peptostreptococcaceae bacterium pGA-8]|nr:DNA-binding transcriptional regulator, FadR family [Peptostreptococcaceae bacterium pGA-8]